MNSLPTDAVAGITRPAEDLAALAAAANSAHEAGEAAARVGLEHFRVAGEALLKAKEQCGHGNWLPWLKENVHFADRTARDYMRLARNWGRGNLADAANLRDALRALTEEDDDRGELSEAPTEGDDLGEELSEPEAGPEVAWDDVEKQFERAMELGRAAGWGNTLPAETRNGIADRLDELARKLHWRAKKVRRELIEQRREQLRKGVQG